jgi:hypothetical protein
MYAAACMPPLHRTGEGEVRNSLERFSLQHETLCVSCRGDRIVCAPQEVEQGLQWRNKRLFGGVFEDAQGKSLVLNHKKGEILIPNGSF